MSADSPIRGLSVKAKLILSYLVILGLGGLIMSLVGSWIVSSTIMMQARRAVEHHLATARTIYQEQLADLRRTVELAASGTTIEQGLSSGDTAALRAYLRTVREDNGLDFLTLADRTGHVILRSTPGRAGDRVSSVAVIAAALEGKVAAATGILAAARLENEDPQLRERAYFRIVPTPRAKPLDNTEETSGMVLLGAAPVRGVSGSVRGVLYGGILLSRNFEIVDHVWDILYEGERYKGRDVGTVTIFQRDLRIATNVRTETGERALGTRVSAEVYDAVLERGEVWHDRAFVVSDWYITAYEPIRDYSGDIVGILYTGQLERVYTAVRNRIIFLFSAVASVAFVLIIAITYYMISNITRPIVEMVAATRDIAAGRFDHELHATAQGEIALLAESFNTMLTSLRQMKADLEEWGRTLEEKVQQRTEELVAMQARVAQSERLASLGMLAAGVAHEINNPLGGILALTALTLEDIPPDDPSRDNLEEVVRQSERCREIVKGLLAFSRQSPAGAESVDINQTLNDTLALFERQALFFNIRLVKELAPSLPSVTADRSQLQQVFMNIILNAVQAMGEKGTLSLVTRRSEADFIEILISDTGCGIPADRIDRIFDPFYSGKGGGEGTGLGLSIAYGIVTKHHGSISVESEVGKGSTFTVRLPTALEFTGPVST